MVESTELQLPEIEPEGANAGAPDEAIAGEKIAVPPRARFRCASRHTDGLSCSAAASHPHPAWAPAVDRARASCDHMGSGSGARCLFRDATIYYLRYHRRAVCARAGYDGPVNFYIGVSGTVLEAYLGNFI